MTDRVICYGDIIDDIVVVPQGPVRPDTDTRSVIRIRPGGSAANTAAWLGELGLPVDFVGVVGSGDAERHQRSLPAVNAILREHPELPTGRVVVVAQNERRDMLTDRGANMDLAPYDVSDAMLQRARLFHLTGHVLLNEAGAAGVQTLIARCKAAGVLVSVSIGSAAYVEELGSDLLLGAISGADIVFAGNEDGATLTGKSSFLEIAGSLGKHFPTAVVTNGSSDLAVCVEGFVRSFGVLARPVADATGAGDAFSAGFLDRWIDGGDMSFAVRGGADLAAEAVGALGGRPTRPQMGQEP